MPYGLALNELMEGLKNPSARLVSCDGNYILRFDDGSRHPQSVQRRAFDAARTKGVLIWVDYAIKAPYAAPAGGVWRMKEGAR